MYFKVLGCLSVFKGVLVTETRSPCFLRCRFTTFTMIAVLLLFNASRATIWVIGSIVLILNGTFIVYMYIHVGTEAAVQMNTKDETEEGGSEENPWRARFKKVAMKVAFAVPKKLLKILKGLKEKESKKVLRVIWGSGVEIGAIDTLKFFLAADEDGNGRGERSRSQLLLKVAGAENMLILAVNGLAVDGALTTSL